LWGEKGNVAKNTFNMSLKPVFPTPLHQAVAEVVFDYFSVLPTVDTVLVVNSCARGLAVPESDLDFAILATADTTLEERTAMETAWLTYIQAHPLVLDYKNSSPFAHVHLDVVSGVYTPGIMGNGEPLDYFEIEIGNQIQYSAPLGDAGAYFEALKNEWLPYYPEELRLARLLAARDACAYDLDHIPFFVKRGLYFQAFDILCKAFQEYLQTLFIANRVYPIAYNKWIKEQIVTWLKRPDLYPQLPPILSVTQLESEEINEKAGLLRGLLGQV
jgi:hypothetical protein